MSLSWIQGSRTEGSRVTSNSAEGTAPEAEGRRPKGKGPKGEAEGSRLKIQDLACLLLNLWDPLHIVTVDERLRDTGLCGPPSSATLYVEALLSSGLERLQDGFRLFVDNAKQCFCRALRLTAPLLPVLEGRLAHTNHKRELRLGYMESLADALNIHRAVTKDAGRLGQAFPYLAPFLNTLDEFVK